MPAIDPMSIPGMITGVECNFLRDMAKSRREIIEIGCWQGRSAVAMLSQSDAKLWCVDPWQTSLEHPEYGWGEDSYREFLKNIDPWRERVRILRMSSIEAWEFIKVMAKPDMVYIDGDHSYRMVKHDIEMGLSVLSEGGFICGHDYCKGRPEVVKAVTELVPEAQELGGYVFGLWYYTVPGLDKQTRPMLY